MPAKEQHKPGDARREQGIGVARNGLYLILAQGLALVLLPTLLVLAWLFLWRQPALEQGLVSEVARGQSIQRADVLAGEFRFIRERLTGVLNDPAVRAALMSTDPASVTDTERAITSAFPGALSLRLLLLNDLGTAGLEEGSEGLRNHIEIDLVRRAAHGEQPPPEAYRVDSDWLLSFPALGPGADEGSPLIALLTYNQHALRRMLGAGGDDRGRFTLLQRLPGTGKNARVVGLEPGPGAESTAIEGTRWQLVFTPGPALVERLEASVAQPMSAMLALLAAALAALLLVALRYPPLLRREVARAAAAAEHRTPYVLRAPELAPLARSLRKLTLRRARMDSADPVPRMAATTRPEPGDPDAPARTPVDGAREDLPSHIFRSYDIRGIADSELDDDAVYRIGAALGTLAGKLGEQTLVLGYDGRTSSGRIKAGLERALLQSGRDVIDIGLVPTPLMQFATHTVAGATSGVMVTASHNPADYNGMKMVLKQQPLGSGDMERLRGIAVSGKFSEGTGHLLQREVMGDYLDEVVSDVAIAMPLKIVVDAGNGAAGHIAPTLFEELGCEVVPLYCDVDGRFPNRSPDCSVAANLEALIDAVRREHADFGVAFDGDGDRLAAVSGSGEPIDADYLLMLFARDVITRNPGADVVYDVKCSRNLAQLVTSLGGRGLLWRSGHSNIRSKMAETGALLGGEFSGHMIFSERWYGFDDGIYAAARLAEIVSSSELSLDHLIGQLPTSYSTPEFLLPVEEKRKFAVIEQFHRESAFGDGRVNDLDGVRVDFPKGWGLLRASNTSATLTARFEADDPATLQDIMTLFREQLARVAPDLPCSF
jgi:phosphomannomutase/phosphoglucomutase